MNLVRKYRVTSLKGFIADDDLLRDINAIFNTKDCPHLMFVGPPGCGKTTLALIIASYFLKRKIKIDTRDKDPDFKVLNASSERGINVVRDVLEDWAKLKPEDAPFKFILLDEVDSSTYDFQHALRYLMEEHDDRCKFILCLNRMEGIKEPALISRCATFKFKKPSTIKAATFFIDIATKEGVGFEDDDIPLNIAEYYDGDLRRMLNDCLQILIGYPNKHCITKTDLHKIYDETAKSVADRVYNSKTPRKTFFDIYKTEAFDSRIFLEEYFLLLGEEGYKYAKDFAKIDTRLRGQASEIIQMNYLFKAMRSNWK